MLWFSHQPLQCLEGFYPVMLLGKTDLKGGRANLLLDFRGDQGFIAEYQQENFANIPAGEFRKLVNLLVPQHDQKFGPVAGALPSVAQSPAPA